MKSSFKFESSEKLRTGLIYDEDRKIQIKCLINHEDEKVKKRKSIETKIADINELFYEGLGIDLC